MICPNKICRQEIPDDSCFCDQCGAQLLRCTKCGYVGTSKFCGKCGSPMAIRESGVPAQPSAAPVTTPPPEVKTQPGPIAPDQPSAATVIVQLPGETIFICHPDGWRLEVRDGDILGRTTGQHAARLGAFPVISGRHAQIARQGAQWRIADLGSTNKTYVNGAKLEPNTPVQIKKNDVLNLANITFTVEEG
ncbi:MAG: FHA domain-containing protein [Treponema sp.]|jgi:hypothetical protein|nr:FHA domain-containing protein [Treponema sp.]